VTADVGLVIVGCVAMVAFGAGVWWLNLPEHRRTAGHGAAWWTLEALGSMGFGYPWTPDAPPPVPMSPTPDEHRVGMWSGCQLLLATQDESSLVLDCLVPGDGVRAGGDSAVASPVALRTHVTDGDSNHTVSRWLEESAPVDIFLTEEHGVAMLRLVGETDVVILELEKAVPAL
jgi:hypothetical protein